MKIKKYLDFIAEKFQADQSDPPEMASDMNTYNSLEKSISDFNQKKVELSNIYMTYKDEADLINKLSARGHIEKKTNNKKQIKFNNPVLALWSQSCELRRKIKDLEDGIKNEEEGIKSEQTNITNNQGNQTIQDSSTSKIDQSKANVLNKKNEVTKLRKEIMDIEKKVNDKLKQMKNDLNISKKRIDYYKINKRSASTTQTDITNQ